MGEISVKTGNNARNGGKNSLNRLIRCVCGKKIGPDPRNFNQRVSLGRNDLLIRTFPSSAVGFNIQLDDCDTSVATKASVAFSGTSVDTTNTSVLALQNSAAGSATNVGVQILDKTGTPLALDGASFSAATTLNDGTNIIPFQARYYATGAATAGTANADATFKVQYE
ncbi:fimbrial protein [Klebsiella pneumoniae]|uniref:fimbrial protein n=1 Tax=Klebsiella pneumoniae TaxID=573 RepID=UPI003879726F